MENVGTGWLKFLGEYNGKRIYFEYTMFY